MDWLNATFFIYAHWSICGTASGHRACTSGIHHGLVPRGFWNTHDIHMYPALAAVVVSGILCGYWEWVAWADIPCGYPFVFQVETNDCNRYRGNRGQFGYTRPKPNFPLADRAIAGIIYSIMMRKLFVEVGFGWAVRILAFVMLSSLVVCYAVMQLDLPQRKPGPLFKIVFLKDASYFAFTLGMEPLPPPPPFPQ